jgi:23S rRNA (cytosine1962-C5)-methyltransferase
MTIKVVGGSDKLLNQVRAGRVRFAGLAHTDLSDRIGPGEWFLLKVGKQESLVGYGNSNAERGLLLRLCARVDSIDCIDSWIQARLDDSIRLRETLALDIDSSRLVYGQADELPGLVVDSYLNAILVELNSMGMWQKKQLIGDYFQNKFPQKKLIIRTKSSSDELLPQDGENEKFEIRVKEDELSFSISSDHFQKLGFYYDHRENRLKLRALLARLSSSGVQRANGVDLFCYMGSWGLNALYSGVQKCTFVDQGDFSDAIQKNLELNGLEGRGDFYRCDAFKFLDRASEKGQQFDLVISDPPAFTKNRTQKKNALVGYQKLHDKCLAVSCDNALFVAASCTSYVSHEELDETVQLAAKKQGKKVYLVDLGIQKSDHPMAGLKSEECYIKYLCYLVK